MAAWVCAAPAFADLRYSDYRYDENANGFTAVVVLLFAALAWQAIREGFKRSKLKGFAACAAVSGATLAVLAYPVVWYVVLLAFALVLLFGAVRESFQ